MSDGLGEAGGDIIRCIRAGGVPSNPSSRAGKRINCLWRQGKKRIRKNGGSQMTDLKAGTSESNTYKARLNCSTCPNAPENLGWIATPVNLGWIATLAIDVAMATLVCLQTYATLT